MPAHKVLFVTYGGGHVNMVLPLIKALRADDYFGITVLGLTTAADVLSRENIPYLGFKDLVHLSSPRALEIGRQLFSELNTQNVNETESIAYLGLNYHELEARFGEEDAAKTYKSDGRFAFFPIDLMTKFLQELKPDLVIATNSPRCEQAVIRAADKNKIPSMCLVDLLGIYEVEWLSDTNYASRITVLNQHVKDFLITNGQREDKIVITGNPVFDKLSDETLTEKANQLRIERGWQDKNVILWAATPEPEYNLFTKQPVDFPNLTEETLDELLSIAVAHPEWIVVIRPHPSQSFELDNLLSNVYLSVPQIDTDLATLLQATDVVLTTASTVGLEALHLSKQLVTIDLSTWTDALPYSIMGLSRGVDNLENLDAALTVELAERPQRNFARQKNATQNILNQIYAICVKSTRWRNCCENG